jgi:hypothetical protein
LGGRSFTLGALAILLQPARKRAFCASFFPVLAEAADLAVTRRSFLNPEFGLIIAASLSQLFPERGDALELLEHLVETVVSNPQNLAVERVALVLRNWLDKRDLPLSQLIDEGWLTQEVVRPLPSDADIFLHRDEATAALTRVIHSGPAQASAEDLRSLDQLICLEASELLEQWVYA